MTADSDFERLVRVEERQDQIFGVLSRMESEMSVVTSFVTTHLAWESALRSFFLGSTKVVAVVGVLVGIYYAVLGG